MVQFSRNFSFFNLFKSQVLYFSITENIRVGKSEYFSSCLMNNTEGLLTFLTVLALVAGVADAGAHDADAVAPAVDVDALVGRHVALGAFPAAVALAAAPRVLSVPTAQHRTGGCNQEDGSVRRTRLLSTRSLRRHGPNVAAFRAGFNAAPFHRR